ncbi:MAG: VWA domain-containing protein [Candidatus Wallbacteria bacterium]|nr:VWA domain-containing protein [Candidatus Wallbacteria bacterium]
MKTIVCFLLTITALSLQAQSILVHQVDTKNYPYVEINFAVMDDEGKAKSIGADDKLLLRLCSPISDFELKRQSGQGYVLLLLDKSGSMRDEIPGLKKAAKYFIDLLPDNFKVSLIAFDRTMTPLCDFSQDKTYLKDAVDKLSSKGATAFYDSVYNSLESLNRMEGAPRYLIALTDGIDQTYDGSPPLSKHTMKQLTDFIKESSIPVYTIALGADSDKDVLVKISEAGDGFYYYMPKGKDLSALYGKLADNLSREYTLRFYSPYLVYDGRTLNLGMDLTQKDAEFHTSREFKVPDFGEGKYFNYENVMPTKPDREQGVKVIITDANGHPVNGNFKVLVNGQVAGKGRINDGEGNFTLEPHAVNENFTALSDQKVVHERPLVKPSRLYVYTVTKDNTFVQFEAKLRGRYNHKYYNFSTTPDGLGDNERLADVEPGEYIMEIGDNGQTIYYADVNVEEGKPQVLKYRFSKVIVAYDGNEIPPAIKMGLMINIHDRKQDKYLMKGKRLFYFVGNDSAGYLPPGDYDITLTDATQGDDVELLATLKYDCTVFGEEIIYTNIPADKLVLKK